MHHSKLKKKVIHGLFWSFSGLIINQIVQFIIQVILARILIPEDFGIIGMITVFIAVSQTLVDSGFASALIREKDPSQDDYSTVFFFSFFMSVLMYLILFLSAGAISSFYNEPKLVPIIRIVAIILVISSLGLIQGTMMVKNLDFKTQSKISVIASIFSGVTAVVLAILGFGVWSLVIRTIIMQLVQSILLCFSIKWRPSLVFKMDSFKRFYTFGWKLMVSSIINTLYSNLYYLIIGKAFSAIQLGYYTNAQKLRDTASQSITTSVQKVSYPALSSIKEDPVKLKKSYRRIIKATVFITFPLLLGLAAIAEPLITLIFGHKWINSIYSFQLLCLAGMLFPLHSINLDILEVVGRSDLFLRLEIIKKIIGLLSIFGVFALHLGIEGLLWAAVINSYLAFFINSFYSSELISYPVAEQIKDIYPVLFSSLIMAAGVMYLGKIFIAGNLLKITVQICLGIIVYLAVCRFLKVKELDDVREAGGLFIKKYKNKSSVH